MSVHINQPKFIDFFRNELKTLQFISTNGTIISKFRQLAFSCEQTFHIYNGYKDKELEKKDFDFRTDFDITIEKATRRVVVESIVTRQYGIVSYVLSVCENKDSPFNILRKFHFDFALPINGNAAPKPVYHIQYGGKQSPHLTTLSIPVDVLHPWLSSPRINTIPINMALLLDLIFCEFQTLDTVKITNDRKWRDHIKHNEDFLLKPYYEKLRGFLSTDHKFSSLLRDYNYGR